MHLRLLDSVLKRRRNRNGSQGWEEPKVRERGRKQQLWGNSMGI